MKVLFAVSNEEISEAIVKRYQRDYKEIISYKNVYYFNAILKEIQKDKTYDRIVISEELEAFANTQYDHIDKMIFEKLDSISDEAANSMGNTPIILISSDRRNKGEEMLVKLFGIGIYDTLIGNDRSVEEVCKLINKPRSKKEAKIYYKIESDEVKYQSENENDVSEQEIQNILAHYKKLGKNEDRYVASFNNIVAQYNDAQLRIISKFLPLNVRAVLEEKSPKYQQIMSFNNSVTNNIRKSSYKEDVDLGPSEKLLKTKNQRVITGPVVIPSSVNASNVKKLAKKHTVDTNVYDSVEQYNQFDSEGINNLGSISASQVNKDLEDMFINNTGVSSQTQKNNQPVNNKQLNKETVYQQPINNMPNVNSVEKINVADDMKLNNQIEDKQQANENNQFRKIEKLEVKPFDEQEFRNKNSQPLEENIIEEKSEETNMIDTNEVENENIPTIQPEAPRRGRGRPRKVISEEEENAKNSAPKRGRGRPRKNPVIEEIEEPVIDSEADTINVESSDNDFLSSFVNNENTNTLSEFDMDTNSDDDILPGFEENTNNDDDMLPGFEENTNNDNDILPGFEENTNNDNDILPGFDAITNNNNNILPGFDNTINNTPNNANEVALPGFENAFNEYQENVKNGEVQPLENSYNNYQSNNNDMLPGFEEDTNNDDMLPGFEDDTDNDDSMLPGFEESYNNYQDQGNQQDNSYQDYDTTSDYSKEQYNDNQYDDGQYEQQYNNQQYNENDEAILPGFEENNNYNDNLETTEQSSYDNYQANGMVGANISNSNNYQPQVSEQYQSNTDFQNNSVNYNQSNEYSSYNYGTNTYKENYQPGEEIDLSRLFTGEKKVATFVGTSKNGTSFIVNNLAEFASSERINVAVLDATKNKNSYYIYTKNEEELRKVASHCLENLIEGQANGIKVNKFLTVYTSLPEDRENLYQAGHILETLLRMHDLVIIDCDFDTPYQYFSYSQEIYLVQSLDILTIQPLTAFLRELKAKNVLDESKLRILLNKYVKVRGISEKTILGGMSKYSDPEMSFMTDLFDVNSVKYRTIPFEQDIYTRYLESVINCDISIKGYSKGFLQILKELTTVIYPIGASGGVYNPPAVPQYNNNTFSADINNTLNQMKKNY